MPRIPARPQKPALSALKHGFSTLAKREGREQLRKRWFFNKGNWFADRDSKTSVQVRSIWDSDSLQHWALRYEHPDSNPAKRRYRRWRSDIAISTMDDGSTFFSVRVSHFRLPGHAGVESEDPQSTSPYLVKGVIGTPNLRCSVDNNLLRTAPIELNDSSLESFEAALQDPTRKLPIVYVSREYQSGEAPLDVRKLAWVLAGLANVYVAESSWTDKLTEAFFPRDYQCWNGMVSVYMPGLDLNKSSDSVRHRYFLPDFLRLTGQEAFQFGLVKSLSIRAISLSTARVQSIDDIDRLEADRQLQLMRERLSSADSIDEIRASYEAYTSEIEKLNTELQIQLDAWKALSTEKDEHLNKSENEKVFFKTENDRLRRSAEDQVAAQRAFLGLSQLPDNKTACANFFCSAYPSRIAMTDRAIESLSNDPFDDLDKVWSALWHMCNTLWPMLFDKRHDNFAKEFERRSTFELAMTEGQLTKENRKMMKEREDTFRGRSIDVTPHVKLFSAGRDARFYFHIDNVDRMLVIGYFGHLTTAGTAKRK